MTSVTNTIAAQHRVLITFLHQGKLKLSENRDELLDITGSIIVARRMGSDAEADYYAYSGQHFPESCRRIPVRYEEVPDGDGRMIRLAVEWEC